MTPSLIEKLEDTLRADFDTARANFILRNQDGEYDLFDTFQVREHDDMAQVFRSQQKIQEFSSVRLALCWCIAQKYQQSSLCNEIVQLDRDYLRLKNMQDALTSIVKKTRDREQRLITRIKSEDNAHKLALVKNRLAKCVSRAKYLQIRGFNDEIARTRRPTPHRTSRPGVRKSVRKKV